MSSDQKKEAALVMEAVFLLMEFSGRDRVTDDVRQTLELAIQKIVTEGYTYVEFGHLVNGKLVYTTTFSQVAAPHDIITSDKDMGKTALSARLSATVNFMKYYNKKKDDNIGS